MAAIVARPHSRDLPLHLSHHAKATQDDAAQADEETTVAGPGFAIAALTHHKEGTQAHACRCSPHHCNSGRVCAGSTRRYGQMQRIRSRGDRIYAEARLGILSDWRGSGLNGMGFQRFR